MICICRAPVLLVACLCVLAGCSVADSEGEPWDDTDYGSMDEFLESNIIYNGNLSLFSFNRWPEYEESNSNKRREIISHLGQLRGIGSREAIWNSYGSIKPLSYGDAYDFQYNDKVVRELEAAGLRYCLQIKVDAMAENPDNYGPEWQRNAEWYIRMVARQYKDSPLYYIPMNEPDNEGQRVNGGAALTTEQIIRVQKVVYETLKGYDPDIMVASSPLCILEDNDQYTSSGRQVLLGGITRYCDYFAFHKHVDIGDDGRLSETVLWDLMDEAEQAGFPRRPALVNENGTWLTLGLVYPEATEEEKHRFKAYWAGNDLIQMKALGLKYIVVYSLAGSLSQDGQYNLMDVDTPVGTGYMIYNQEYSAYRDLWVPEAHRISNGINGSFEEPNPDKSRGWVVSFRGRSFNGIGRVEPKEWDYVSITDSNARSGGHSLKMTPIDFVPTASIDFRGITANRCRRLVEGLVPGRSYSISAWVKFDGTDNHDVTPSVSLRALGFDSLGKRAEAAIDASAGTGAYRQLSVSFVADNPWVVISLEHNGSGTVYWDDVSIR